MTKTLESAIQEALETYVWDTLSNVSHPALVQLLNVTEMVDLEVVYQPATPTSPEINKLCFEFDRGFDCPERRLPNVWPGPTRVAPRTINPIIEASICQWLFNRLLDHTDPPKLTNLKAEIAIEDERRLIRLSVPITVEDPSKFQIVGANIINGRVSWSAIYDGYVHITSCHLAEADAKIARLLEGLK